MNTNKLKFTIHFIYVFNVYIEMFLLVFNLFILLMVVLDFLVLSRNPSIKNAIFLTIIWIVLGLSFSCVIYIQAGFEHFCEYLSSYCIEKSLSIDNIFVFLMIFNHFEIEEQYQRKLLFVGIWSALIFRILMIFMIGELLSKFHFMLYIFGILLVFIGISSFFKTKNLKFHDRLLKIINNHTNFYEKNHNGHFFVKQDGKYKVTTLIVVIICIEICDVVFAFDSIPALFSITDNKVIIYTSNAFALIGMRSLYIVFARIVDTFYYLKYCIGVVLIFIGIKMIISDLIHISSVVSFTVIVVILLSPFVISKITMRFGK